MSKTDFTFNFGPISRTLGPNGDCIGFASLPVHEVSTAFLGAQGKDEFIAWLWHDIFKALFTFRLNPRGGMNWQHFYLQNVLGLEGHDDGRSLYQLQTRGARLLAGAQESRGWSVWWDPKLRAGEHFDDVIEQTIRNVKCVIVL